MDRPGDHNLGNGKEIPRCGIYVDKEGDWYYLGNRIVHPGVLELFWSHLDVDEEGRYLIRLEDETCYLEVEDTPFVVLQVTLTHGENEVRDVFLHLSDGTVEPLDPESFFIGPQDVPYCRIRGGRFIARFSRKALYQISRIIEEGDSPGAFRLRIRGRVHPIPFRKERQ